MAFEGGPLNVIGITPSYVTELGTTTASSGAGQVWQGAGGSFAGSAAQGITGGLAGSTVNVALNSALGTDVVGPQGISLDSGQNVLASVITPQVTASTAAGINQQIQQSLQNAGPFGAALSGAATSAVSTALQGVSNVLGIGAASNFKMFPGGGGAGEAPANYGGSSYTLSDIVFSIQPANLGPQTFGSSFAAFSALSQTSVPFGDFTSTPPVTGNTGLDILNSNSNLDFFGEGSNDGSFPGAGSSVASSAGSISGGGAGWTFITAPEDVNWSTTNQVKRVDMFGTNNPPVVPGTKGMRELTLSNALVEGFVRNISVEGKILILEDLMKYGLNGSDGYVSIPVFQVWASNKSYGGPNAYYVIKSVKFKEKMRDLDGNATRAYVDVDFIQVPAYQVNTGRDQASAATSGAAGGAGGGAAGGAGGVASQANQGVPGAGSAVTAGSAGAKAASGASAPKPAPPPPVRLGQEIPIQRAP